MALHQAGQLAAALPLYQSVLDADSTNAQAHYLHGATCHGLGNPAGAITGLSHAVRLQPNHPEAHNHLGAVLAEEGQFDQAVACIEQALRLRPGNVAFVDNLRSVSATQQNRQGTELVAQAKFAEASTCYRRALELSPDFLEAISNLAAALEKQVDLTGAAACCRRALELDSEYAAAHHNLGAVLQRQGHLAEAETCYRRSLELEPTLIQASNNLALLLAHRKRVEEAQRASERSDLLGLRSWLARTTERLLSPGEREAWQNLRRERTIAANHRRGLKQIRAQQLARPARLNLGCGSIRKAGFLNVDLDPGGDLTLDLRRGLPFDAACCELIFSEHCFEHFDYPEPISQLFRDCLRVLRPGGTLLFSVPGSEWPLTEYRDGPNAPYFQACRKFRWHPADCTTRLEHINDHFRQGGEHRFAYDLETVEKVLRIAGFVDVRPRDFDGTLDSEHRRVGSLFIVARKAA